MPIARNADPHCIILIKISAYCVQKSLLSARNAIWSKIALNVYQINIMLMEEFACNVNSLWKVANNATTRIHVLNVVNHIIIYQTIIALNAVVSIKTALNV